MREIVLDTETTGLDPKAGHRIVEIACLELVNKVPTGNTFQEYLNPEREVPKEAERIHGLSNALLEDKPRFEEIADRFLAFIEEASLVIHNADFDLGFINAEFERVGRPPLDPAQGVIDTVRLARKKFPGAQASLDALCRRFEIDNSSRSLHGALLDCQLLAEVYLELVGGRQPGLDLGRKARAAATTTTSERLHHPPRPHEPSAEEIAAHGTLIETLEDPIWRH